MGLFSKENLNKLKNVAQEGFSQAVETTTDLAKKTKEVAVDVYENSGEVGANLQVSALSDNLSIAYVNWLSVYADEMFNGADEFTKGSLVLQGMKANLIKAQSDVKKGSGKKLAELIGDLDSLVVETAIGSKPESLYVINQTIKALPEKLDVVLANKNVLAALENQGTLESTENLIEAYAFEQREAAVASKCNLDALTELAGGDLTDVLGITSEIADKDGVDILRELCQAARGLTDVEDGALNQINALSNEVSLYNLKTTVSGGAAAYAGHYATQMASSAAKYTGQAMSYLSGLKNKY
jgi:hypothetical protein